MINEELIELVVSEFRKNHPGIILRYDYSSDKCEFQFLMERNHINTRSGISDLCVELSTKDNLIPLLTYLFDWMLEALNDFERRAMKNDQGD